MDARPAQETSSTPAPAVLRWGPLVAFVLLLLALARHAGSGISDPDTLWHVLAGEHLWRTHDFAGPDPYSTFTTQPWVLNQWLPELAMAWAHHLGGLPAVAWLASAGQLAVCASLLALCRGVAGPLAAALVAGAAVLGTADSLSPRPQLVGFVLLAVVIGAWLRTARDLRPRWWLVAVTWLWACCHGTWVVGVTVGAAVVLGVALDGRSPRPARDDGRRQEPSRGPRATRGDVVRLAGVVVASAAATALTPLGLRLYESFATVRAVSPYILEWRRPTLDSPSVLVTLALVLLVPLLWAARRTLPRWSEGLLWLVAVAWGVSSMRTVGLCAVIVAPLAARALDRALGRARVQGTAAERVLVGAGLVLALGLAGLLASTGPEQPQGVPSRLDASLSALAPGTVVWNTDLLGGWLMYAHPELRHTADTRAEIYGPARARAYLRVLSTEPGWEQDFDQYGARAALVERDAPLVAALEARGWGTRGTDAGYVLLEPATGR
ncbi:hypothetical protein [Phycicoccus sp. Soil748]|uniref:hypothetical protein n=1 Tax=Phycicoccus sp. Soil748 TaxID=1736397 RepID=UPI0012E3E311|nr:hypothetical protein [Phycicoccus sp. Soil748]